MFELALPHYSKNYTSDWVDVILYVVGGVFFYKIENRPIVAGRRGVECN
jgi:hypothetical protein